MTTLGLRPALPPRAGRTEASASGQPDVPARLAPMMRPVLPELIAYITDEIQRQIVEYSDEADESMVATTRVGVSRAITYFVDHIEDPSVSRDEVDELFRRLGQGEAFAGRSLDSLRTAYQIAARRAWKSLHAFALAQGLPSSTLGELGDALFDFINVLSDQSAAGFRDAQTQLSDAAYQWRERLLQLILSAPASSEREIRELAASGSWPVPTQVVMIAIAPTAGKTLPSPRRLHPRTLADLKGEVGVVLHPAPWTAGARAEIESIFAGHTVSIGSPVRLADAVASLRWARRGLQLMQLGVLERQPVLDCGAHLATLWLHSEPLLAERLCRRALGPLYAEPPHSRRILAETLLAWMETRGSAPMLARHLGKHAQTIRYRLKRVHDLFGDALEDDERCFEMHLALRATMPLWTAERPGRT